MQNAHPALYHFAAQVAPDTWSSGSGSVRCVYVCARTAQGAPDRLACLLYVPHMRDGTLCLRRRAR